MIEKKYKKLLNLFIICLLGLILISSVYGADELQYSNDDIVMGTTIYDVSSDLSKKRRLINAILILHKHFQSYCKNAVFTKTAIFRNSFFLNFWKKKQRRWINQHHCRNKQPFLNLHPDFTKIKASGKLKSSKISGCMSINL